MSWTLRKKFDFHLRVQARSRAGRWCWTLKRAQKRLASGRWGWAQKVGLLLLQLFVNSSVLVTLSLRLYSSQQLKQQLHSTLMARSPLPQHSCCSPWPCRSSGSESASRVFTPPPPPPTHPHVPVPDEPPRFGGRKATYCREVELDPQDSPGSRRDQGEGSGTGIS